MSKKPTREPFHPREAQIKKKAGKGQKEKNYVIYRKMDATRNNCSACNWTQTNTFSPICIFWILVSLMYIERANRNESAYGK